MRTCFLVCAYMLELLLMYVASYKPCLATAAQSKVIIYLTRHDTPYYAHLLCTLYNM